MDLSCSQTTPLDQNYLNAYHWYTITFVAGVEKVYIDDSLKVTHASTLTPMPVEFRAYSGVANDQVPVGSCSEILIP